MGQPVLPSTIFLWPMDTAWNANSYTALGSLNSYGPAAYNGSGQDAIITWAPGRYNYGFRTLNDAVAANQRYGALRVGNSSGSDSLAQAFLGSWTVELFTKWDATQTPRSGRVCLFSHYANYNSLGEVGVLWGAEGPTGLYVGWENDAHNQVYADLTTPLAIDGNWRHLAYRRSGGTVTFFVNGTLVGTVSGLSGAGLDPGFNGTTTEHLTLGYRPLSDFAAPGSYLYNGYTDDVRLSNVALSDATILSDADYTAPTYAGIAGAVSAAAASSGTVTVVPYYQLQGAASATASATGGVTVVPYYSLAGSAVATAAAAATVLRQLFQAQASVQISFTAGAPLLAGDVIPIQGTSTPAASAAATLTGLVSKHEKLWSFCLNTVRTADFSSVAAVSKSILLSLKNMLIANGVIFTDDYGSPTSPPGKWSIYYSCDGNTAGTANDGVDRWLNNLSITRATAGSAHSWMVLKSPTMSTATFQPGAPLYMILDASGTTDQVMLNLTFSKAAPTGGTTTARPTATDEWTHGITALNDNTATEHSLFLALASSGAFWFGSSKRGQGYIAEGIAAFLLENTDATDVYPWLTMFGSYGGAGSSRGAYAQASFYRYTSGGSASGGMFRARSHTGTSVLTMESPILPWGGTGASGLYVPWDYWPDVYHDRQTNKAPRVPIYVFAYDTAGATYYAYRGRLPDFFWGQTTIDYGNGDTLSGGTNFVNCGGTWVPVNAGLGLG